jgi:pyrroline-5-carboxylate reductase
MNNKTIGFVGGGNMARSLIGGLINSGLAAERISVFDPNTTALQSLQSDFGIQIVDNNQQLVEHCDTVVLAVKPQALKAITAELDTSARRDVLFLSIVAGIRTDAIQRWLGDEPPLVRAMPNTPALVQSGATALFATAQTNETQRNTAESILRAVGLVLWVDNEDQLDAVTALSGSGPAYFFLVMEAMEAAATKLGLDAETAHLLTLETAFGAAKLALELGEPAAELRQRVTSKGGTTEQALEVFSEGNLKGLFERALTAAQQRSRELAKELGD